MSDNRDELNLELEGLDLGEPETGDLPETDSLLSDIGALLEEAETEAPQEQAAPAPAPKKKKSSKWLYYGLLAVFAGVFIFSAVKLIDYFTEARQAANIYDDLAARVQAIRDQQAAGGGLTGPSHGTGGNGGTGSAILPEYQEAYNMNNDMVGWIRIEGTKIDYPVMHTPGRTDYYLKRGFDKKWSAWGAIYVKESCDVFTPSDNVTIYGHYMQDGQMFHDLHGYYSSKFYREHQFIQFDTLYERHTYQIIAVFKTSGNAGEGFAYHMFDYAESEEEFNNFIAKVRELQMYYTGVQAKYGDMLITLSTCEYSQENGRLVVVAKRVS